jgi:murein DD-endopeptidase MepM/ murein hydrolase activator NlpD
MGSGYGKRIIWAGLVLLTAGSTLGMAGSACPDLIGNTIQGGLVSGTVPQNSVVMLNDRLLEVLPDGTFLAGFGRDAPARAELVVSGGMNCRLTLEVSARDYKIQRVEGVPQKTVTPSAEHQARIARERLLVGAAKAKRYRRPDLLQEALSGFIWPAVGPISGVYGSQRFYNGVPSSPHYGVDVALPSGSPVTAPSGGIVTLAESDLFFSGGTIILDHGYGLSSSFLHLSKVLVEVGQQVTRGALIGEIGASGRATGPHLDWRMSWRSERIDPGLLVPPMPAAE